MEESRENEELIQEEAEAAAAGAGDAPEADKAQEEAQQDQAGDQHEAAGEAEAPEAAEAAQETGEEEPAAFEPEPITEVAPGQVIQGVIRRVDDDVVIVDVGYKADGVVPRSELTLGPGQSPRDLFEEGQPIHVCVLSIDPRDDGLLLSERRARSERAWEDLEAAYQEQRIIKAPVVEAVKGGLVIDVGARAFMPASHVERGFVSDLEKYVGQTVRARVIELDRSKNRIILSQKVVLEEEYQKKREETWSSLEEGQIRTGVVKGITDFGAFVDLGGVDGLLHVSEMAWHRVDHPSDVVSESQEIQVKVMKVDRENERISLSLKQTLPDPWEGVEARYPVGAIVKGQVVRLAPFGAFVRLEPGVEGLVHISQLADFHVKTPDEVVREGETVAVKILRVQPEERRVSLSIKDAAPNVEPTPAPAAPPARETASQQTEAAVQDEQRRPSPAPQPRKERSSQRSRARQEEPLGLPPSTGDGITLGEMFGDLFEETKERLVQQQRNAGDDSEAGEDGESGSED